MPYSGDSYGLPSGTAAVSGATISSTAYNTFTSDIEDAQNHARPISAGGTGSTTAQGAINALFSGGKTVDDDELLIADPADNTKRVRLDAGNVTAGQTRVLTAPDFNGTIATLAGTETLTNKTINSSAFNGTIGGTTPAAGAFTTLSVSTSGTFGGNLTFSDYGDGVIFGGGGKMSDTPTGGNSNNGRTVLQANNGSFDIVDEAFANFIVSIDYTAGTFTFKGNSVWHAGNIAVASQAEQETASTTDRIVTPGRQQFHPSAAKGWVKFDSNGTNLASYNVTSITDNGTGDFRVTWNVDFSSNQYCAVTSCEFSSSGYYTNIKAATSAGVTDIRCWNPTVGLVDASNYFVVGYGDQ